MTTYHLRWYHSASASPGSRGTSTGCPGEKTVYISDTHRSSLHVTMQHIRSSRMLYIKCKDIVMDENHKPKRLWSFIKSYRTRGPTKAGWKCIQRYQGEGRYIESAMTSVFTSENPVDPLHIMEASPHPTFPNITVHQAGHGTWLVSRNSFII